MFSLAHISDIHLSPLPLVSVRDLLSKRITGYVNWKLERARNLSSDTLASLVEDMKFHQPDHIAITGDLVNLALVDEFETSKKWLHNLGPSDKISVVPGNHDAYVPSSLRSAYRAWQDFMPLAVRETGNSQSITAAFPFVRRLGPVAIIGVSSATASPPFLAIGRFEHQQALRLQRALKETADEGLFRVILIHHPPIRYNGDAAKRLYGVRLFQKTILEAGAELVLHGHTHIISSQHISDENYSVPVIGVPSASQSPGGHRPAAQWNGFQISGAQGSWNCHLTVRGVLPNKQVGQIASRAIWQNGAAVRN